MEEVPEIAPDCRTSLSQKGRGARSALLANQIVEPHYQPIIYQKNTRRIRIWNFLTQSGQSTPEIVLQCKRRCTKKVMRKR